jgi:predicted Rossmann fold nucleotide-binding protein DprA/Smf involved in DNA uptake
MRKYSAETFFGPIPIPAKSTQYLPALWTSLNSRYPPVVHGLGNPDLLAQPLLALFCARQCPARLLVKAQDWARSVRDQGAAIISGFHTPVEKECFRVLLKGSCNLVICPARALPKRVPGDWRGPIEKGRLLVLSFFPERQARPTAAMALERSRLLSALAAEVLILHAPMSSKTFALGKDALTSGKSVWTLADSANEPLSALGARVVEI